VEVGEYNREDRIPEGSDGEQEYTELKLGGNRKNGRLQQFLENDRKVLRFYSYWDDPTRYGSRQYFVMHYFLCDDTVEILNAYARNSGRDPYPVFFTRGPLKLQPGLTHTPGMVEKNTAFLRPEDVKVGEFIPVYGRNFFVYDCDDATKDFYKEYSGVEPKSVSIPEDKKEHYKLKYPPHTGFGSEEDSLGSCLSLQEHVPKKDLVKLMTNSGRILRYEARCDNGLPEDEHRKFIIGVYLADDTVAVWEVRQRNSGQVEGKFAQRSKKINPETGKSFQPNEFFVGASAMISGMMFTIMRSDEYTLKFMESNPEVYPMSNIDIQMKRLKGLKEKLGTAGPATVMDPESFRDAVQMELGVPINEHELVTIVRYCCNESAQIQIAKVYEMIDAAQLLRTPRTTPTQ